MAALILRCLPGNAECIVHKQTVYAESYLSQLEKLSSYIQDVGPTLGALLGVSVGDIFLDALKYL